MSRLALFLLGPPRIECDGAAVHIPRRKAIALLAYLSMTTESHSRDALATLLWPESDQSQARASLRAVLAVLRRVLGEGRADSKHPLDVDREIVGLDPDAEVWLDVAEFQARLAECRTHDHPPDQVCPACLSSLAEAATLYRDDFLAGFTLRDSPAFDDWQFFQTEGLRDDLAGALERLAHRHSAQGEFERAIPYARRWVALDPLHEPAHRCLMQLYARSDQRAAALRQYAECERVLQEELGVPPDEETAQLYQAIKEKQELPPPEDRIAMPLLPVHSAPPSSVLDALLNDRYRLDAEIGRGGMGTVYRAHDLLLERDVAVKVLSASALSAESRARLLREAQAAARLNHPNVVSVYDAGKARGIPFIVMELVEGESLHDHRPQALEEIVSMAQQVCDALEHAHDHGIVHRDLKPENVMIAPDGTAKLMDFGLVRTAASRLTAEGAIVGTPFYLAPEQALGGEIDHRADLYALGILLYELTTGQLPFASDEVLDVISQHLHAPVVPPRTHNAAIPPPLEALIVRLLSKQPEDRPASAAEVRQALDDLLQPEALVETHPDHPNNLPVQLTPFVGREAMLAHIAERLQDPACRLLTLVGPGGSGKTRLALKAAEVRLEDYVHGIFFVSLTPLSSVEAIVPTVAQALGFTFYEGTEPQQQLLDYLRQKTMLLIMDNYEHLLGGTRLVTDILKAAPQVKILATSRARLNVGGEHRFQIGGMHYPEPTPKASADVAGYSAVKLFLQGARRAQPGFELTGENLSGVVQVCRLVEGLPLGIRLAAAWVGMLTPAEIAAEIGHSLDLLATDRRDVPQRQRSMRATLDHSWRLLSEREREVLQGLSVFHGGFTRPVAQQVTGATLHELMALVDRSLLHRTPMGRYEVHELTRQYAADKLRRADKLRQADKLKLSPAAWETARDRHCAYYIAALQGWEADLKSARQQTALAEMDVEIENARSAWHWATEQGQVERLDEAMEGLCLFYEWRGRYQEGEAACRIAASRLATAERLSPTATDDRPALNADGTSVVERTRVLAKVWTWQSVFSWRLGHREVTSQLLRQSLALLEGLELTNQDTQSERAFALLQMGEVVVDSDREKARRLFEQSLTLYRALGDRWGTATVLYTLSCLAWNLGTKDEAKQLAGESLALQRALGDQRGLAYSLRVLGATITYEGQHEEAERLLRESLAICQKMADQAGVARGLINLGGSLIFPGRLVEAHSLVQESLPICKDLGSFWLLALGNAVLGCVEVMLGQYGQARSPLQRGAALAREVGFRRGIAISLHWLGQAALAEGAYAEAQQLFCESAVIYREIEQQDELGWLLVGLGCAVRRLGDPCQARQHLHEALQTAAESGAFGLLVLALPAIALLLADKGEHERAVELYALASRYPYVANSRWFEDVFGQHIAAVAATLPPEVVAAAQERGRARDLWATATELLAELEEEQSW